jgi:hypothetical protein
MSQKSYVVLTASVTLAIPAGKTQAQTLEIIKTSLGGPGQPFHPGTVIVKPLKRETHYISPL